MSQQSHSLSLFLGFNHYVSVESMESSGMVIGELVCILSEIVSVVSGATNCTQITVCTLT